MNYREKLVDRLKDMPGNNYEYHHKYYLVDKYEITENFVRIFANGIDQMTMPYQDALDTITNKWIKCETAEELQNADMAVTAQNLTESTDDIQTILLDSIKKIQVDKTYIPQAKAITNIANTLLNAYKVNIMLRKVVNKQNIQIST